mmetsp:Transcript_18384/g.37622  ORF Transcript_18384/g.37622 Transcript_18384/m.37622 type:complete len:190 (+) Transcript_18384:193-762(+)
MGIVGLAVVGKNNSPLYAREFLSDETADGYDDDRDDEAVLFGLTPRENENDDHSHSERASNGCCWFVVHAALDRLEQLTLTTDGKKKILPTIGTNNNFAGLLFSSVDTRVYGYLTNTGAKFVLVVEEEGPNAAEKTATEAEKLFGEVHDLYVRELMNPFRPLSPDVKSLSRSFDDAIQKRIAEWNQSEI